jgi:glycosyltransferase 2 family protein
MNKKAKTIIQFCLFLGLGIFLVWWSIKDLSFEDTQHIKNSLSQANFWFAIPGFAVLLLSHYIRALRWNLLIEPLGYIPAKANSFFAVMIGYLANQAVPRLGEVLKCTTLNRYEKIPLDKLFGTIIIERIFDTICLFFIFVFTLSIQPSLYSKIIHTFFISKAGGGKSNLIIIALIAFIIVTLAVLGWMLVSKKSIADLYNIFTKIALRIWEGITSILHLQERGLFFLYTIILWVLYSLGGYIGFLALQETSSFGATEALTVLCAGSVGMIATPGGIGAYAFLLQKTLQLYGLNAGTALAFGWLMWLMQIIVVLLGGLYSLIALPWYNGKRKQTMASK